jgi:hypothetical protein
MFIVELGKTCPHHKGNCVGNGWPAEIGPLADSGLDGLSTPQTIMQSIFSVAARRGTLLGDTANAERRAGALKMDWTEPLHDARPMCIEWLAEG